MTKIEVDNHKLMYHSERVSEWMAKGDCAPIYVEIGPTNRCNHRCSFCALDWLTRGGSDIDSEVLIRNLQDMANYGVRSVMFAGEGEPFLHKDISAFVTSSHRARLDSSITTNGVLLDKRKAEECLPYLSWIRFSVDAGTPSTYADLHGTREEDFTKVWRNIRDAVEVKRSHNYPVTIGIQALLTYKSLPEMEMLTRMSKEFGVDNLQIKPYSHHPSSKNDLSFNFNEAEKLRYRLEEISDKDFQVVYRTMTINRLFSKRDYNSCHGLPFFALVDSGGNIFPCNLFYGDSKFSYGNIHEKLFSEIWESDKRKEIVKKINRQGVKSCRIGCRLDVINRYLHRIKNPLPHDNFI